MKSATSSSGACPDCAQTEIDAHLLNRKLEACENEDDIAHNHTISDAEEAGGDEDNEDWIEDTIMSHVAEQDFL